jgi:CDP-diglyceride synthetase
VSNRTLAILIGGSVGAALGATAGWFYMKAQEEKLASGLADGRQLRLQAGAPEYVKIAIALLALMKQVTDLFKPL